MEGCFENYTFFSVLHCLLIIFKGLSFLPIKYPVALSHTDTNYSNQGHFKPVLINNAMPDLAYNQNKIFTLPYKVILNLLSCSVE